MKILKDSEYKKLKIQATEGAESPVDLESLLTGQRLNDSGIDHIYSSYGAQVSETYSKYNGRATLGNWQTRAVIDTRTGFISGEGISVQAENEKTAKWIDDFLTYTRLKGTKFFNLVKGGEMSGKQLIVLIPDKETKQIRVVRIPYYNNKAGSLYKVILKDNRDLDAIKDIIEEKDGAKTSMKLKHFKYVRLGGDDTDVNETTTRTGLVLNELENYDRCLNGMRKNNHLFSKITPAFETTDKNSTANLLSWISRVKWKIGLVFAGTSKLYFPAPPTTAHDNYKSEMVTLAKAISATTGIPIHWLGHVEMMSNRSTAEELYEVINNATTIERSTWSESIYEIILKAQQLSIDNGFGQLSVVDKEFEVKIPLVNFSKIFNYVKALSTAFGDGVISIKDYQNMLPSIDPYKTQKNIEKENSVNNESFAREIADLPEEKETDE